MIYRPDRYGRGGDHLSFLSQGFPAVRFTEPHENYAHQHQDVRTQDGIQYGDLIDYVDFEYVARVAKVNGVALYSLAQAPGTPKNVKLDSSQGYASELSWDMDDSEGADGYEVVWRPAEYPVWTNVVEVGMTGTASVNISKDDVQFGVRAVGSNGYKSPAGFST